MKNLYIIGDSHSVRMGQGLFDNIIKKMSISEPYSIYTTEGIDKLLKKDDEGNPIRQKHEVRTINFKNRSITCASYLGRSALRFDYKLNRYMNFWDDEDSTVMPWLGYIDVKNYLPNKKLKKYVPVHDVVDTYVENTLKSFKKSKLIFINPMPQFEVVVTARWRNFSGDPDIPFEDRHEEHLLFSKALKEKCLSVGLEEPIMIEKILNVPWIGTTMQYKTPLEYIYNDHCTPEYYDRILEHILDRTGFNIGP